MQFSVRLAAFNPIFAISTANALGVVTGEDGVLCAIVPFDYRNQNVQCSMRRLGHRCFACRTSNDYRKRSHRVPDKAVALTNWVALPQDGCSCRERPIRPEDTQGHNCTDIEPLFPLA